MENIIVIGAGLGGLTAALRLHQAGFTPKVYEAAPEILPLGVGIDVKVYGAKELDELGLLEKFEEISVQAEDSIFFNRWGQEIYAEKCGTYMGYKYDQRFVHRGTLQMLLLDTVKERLGEDAVITDRRATGYTQDGESVTVSFADTAGNEYSVTAGSVIAADGIHSAFRKQMHPDLAAPKYSGLTMWRGVTLMDPIRNGRTILHIGDPDNSSLIVYPIRDNWEGTGKTLVNWVSEAVFDQTLEDWNQPGTVDQLLPLHEGCDLGFIDPKEILTNAEAVYLYPLIDHDPLDSWADGRVVLMGDAAHAMYPRGGNGACQAIVDARVITEKLVELSDPAAAFKAFEDERLETVNRIVLANRGEGYEVIRRMVAERTDNERITNIEEVLPLEEANQIFSKYHTLVGQGRAGEDIKLYSGYRTEAAPLG